MRRYDLVVLGGGVDYFVDNSFNYPTLAEAYKVAALNALNRLQSHVPTVVELEVLKGAVA
ncbi:MAG: hypothetical protein ABIM50_11025 [Novosphingobium sp.]